jgi:hypothetical protein
MTFKYNRLTKALKQAIKQLHDDEDSCWGREDSIRQETTIETYEKVLEMIEMIQCEKNNRR